MPRSKSQHKEEEPQKSASRINLTCWSDAEERKGKKQNEHTCFGWVGGGFLTIDRNLLLNSNRKTPYDSSNRLRNNNNNVHFLTEMQIASLARNTIDQHSIQKNHSS
jgi:hypothetical protein